jgi:putative membrane-bound dehydrogenase-like protein
MNFRIILLAVLLPALACNSLLGAGRQLTGVYSPAATPALHPDEAQKKFTVPPGFEVRLFAAEPDVINPVAMTWDDRGRLWVVELYEYPLGAPAGAKPRDRVKILEDTTGDGRADKVTVFADGLNLATGILLGYGGAFVGQAPHLLFMEDTDGDDVADKTTIAMTGFGLEDRHELLNGFTWGPDGWLYMTHGVFTHSKVKNPDDPDDDGVIMNAAVARWHPRTKKFENFADGTSNPWGVDFDRFGNAFVSACVIDHLFHMAPGGIYVRQAGSPAHPYGYQLLPSIVDHRHFRAAYAGVQIYQGDQYPEEFQGMVFMGNIHDNSVHQDRLERNGSSFKASFVQDFVRANDGWFRPVSVQTGPDGALWLMDWHDKYPCYQNAQADPEGVNRTHGRIWRVVYTGDKPGAPVPPRPPNLNLGQLRTSELIRLLEHRNSWHRRTAQRILSERRDPQSQPALERMLRESPSLDARLASLWTLHSSGLLTGATLDRHASDRNAAIRTWVARLTGERANPSEQALHRLETLAQDRDPSVRLAVATAARQYASSSLTVNTPVPPQLAQANTGQILAALVEASATATDPVIPFMIWMAAEPKLMLHTESGLNWFAENGAQTMPLSGQLVRKFMRRICDSRDTAKLNQAVQFIDRIGQRAPSLAVAALDGLLEGQKGKALLPSIPTSPILARLGSSTHSELVNRAQQLGTLWGDPAAFQGLLRRINETSSPTEERIKAIQVARQLRNDAARDAMFQAVSAENPDPLIVESIRALGEIGGDAVPAKLIARWNQFSASARNAASQVLASRPAWALEFLTAVEASTISPGELPVTVIRSLAQNQDETIRERARQAIGRIREPDADKTQLIAEKRKVVLEGPIDFKAGYEITKQACLICHKLHGEGSEVGPDLTGVGRSTLDALLAHVIDPNQIIGKGYENVEIETKDGRSVGGRLIEDTDNHVKILSVGAREETIARSDIDSLRITENSVMPEGLEQMPDADFRNMIWYILNPPGDNRPWTPELRQELIGEQTAATQPIDGESVALWNPLWRVIAPEFQHSPKKLPEFEGRKNVLVTHPYDSRRGAALERVVDLPPNKQAILKVAVASHEEGDWELRVLGNDELIHKRTINRNRDTWKQVEVDLKPFAGKKVALRLENCANNNWHWEFGYWSDLELLILD